MKVRDLTGKTFGKLKVIAFAAMLPRKQGASWLCKCNCGTEKVIAGGNLTRSHNSVKSCGCLQKEHHFHRGEGEAAAHEVFCQYKNRSKKEFKLTEKEFLSLLIRPCEYCGEALTQERKRYGRSFGSFKYTGLDRVDSTKGYTNENVVPCCSMCNYMKRHHTTDNFINQVEKIHEHTERRQFFGMDKWDTRFLHLAKFVSQWSKDRALKPGQ